MSHFRPAEYAWKPIPVEETREYKEFLKAMENPKLVGGYLAQTVAPFITVYLSDLQQNENHPPFLQKLLGSPTLAPGISNEPSSWRYMGYGDRPLPKDAEGLRHIDRSNQVEINGNIETKFPPTHHSHAFQPIPTLPGLPCKTGTVLVDREKYYDCGKNSFVGWELVPLTEALYKDEYADSFKAGELFCFDRSLVVWELKKVAMMPNSQNPLPMMQFTFEQS
jgi:hypothetical protein